MKNVYISGRARPEACGHISEMGHNLIRLKRFEKLYDAVCDHPDMFYCALPPSVGGVIKGDPNKIGARYPKDIVYNAVMLDKYLIHNLKYTASEVMEKADELGLEKINVKQGYTKCSCVVVDGKSIITADEGIYKVLSKYDDIDVLKIRPGGVILPGMDEGFLGGCTGKVGDELIFHGDLSKHPDCAAIMRFIESRGLRVKYFTGFPLTDIGSIIEE